MNCTPDQTQVAMLTPDVDNEAQIFCYASFLNHNLPSHINNNSTTISCNCTSVPAVTARPCPVHITATSNGSPYTMSCHHPYHPHLYNRLSTCMATGSDLSIKKGAPLHRQLICLRIHYACPIRKLRIQPQ